MPETVPDPNAWRPAPPMSRGSLLDRLDAYRHDPRFVAVALALLAGLGALVWLQLGVPRGDGGSAPSAPDLGRADRVAVGSSPTAARSRWWRSRSTATRRPATAAG